MSSTYLRRHQALAGQGEDPAWTPSGCVSGHALSSSFPRFLVSSFGHFSIYLLKGLVLGVIWIPSSSLASWVTLGSY